MNEAALYLAKLLAAAVSSETPSAEAADFSEIYRLAKKNAVLECAAYAVAALPAGLVPEDAARLFSAARDRGIALEAMRSFEQENIESAFAKAGVDMCILKGAALKSLYPSPDMRSMSDLDIMAEHSAAEPVMLSLGYNRTSETLDEANWYKLPFVHVELHENIVPRKSSMHAYYADVKSRLLETRPHIFRMTAEDEYIFNVAHFYRHFMKSGSGLRSVLDIWVMETRGERYDRAYLDRELSKLGILDFERQMSRLAAAVFGGAGMTPDLEPLLDEVVGSGVYGSLGKRMLNTMSVSGHKSLAGAKLHYLKDRLFPPFSRFADKSAAVRKCPPLVVFAWIGFVVRGVVKKPAKLRNELQMLKKVRREDVNSVLNLDNKKST